jgi:hypothetical protein
MVLENLRYLTSTLLDIATSGTYIKCELLLGRIRRPLCRFGAMTPCFGLAAPVRFGVFGAPE